jgi:hypothetical protein
MNCLNKKLIQDFAFARLAADFVVFGIVMIGSVGTTRSTVRIGPPLRRALEQW